MLAPVTFVYILGISALFLLDRDREARTSKALWIPVLWLWIAGSRTVSQWMMAFGSQGPVASSADQILEGSPADRAVLTGLLVLGVIVLVRRGRKVGRLVQANLPILLFFLYCAISIFWSDFPEVAFKRWTKAVGDIVMILVVLSDRDPSNAVKRLLARTGFVLIPVSVLLIKYFPDLGRAYSQWTWTPTYGGITTNKNTLGMICLIFGLGSAWRFLSGCQERSNRARHLIAHGAILGMVLWLFWMANSMTSLSCFLMASGLMAATSLGGLVRRPRMVHICVLAILAVSVSALFLDVGSGLVADLGRDPSLTGRTELWDHLIGMNQSSIIGCGFESFWLGTRLEKLWSIYWWHPNEAHNGYLEVFLNLGWIGVSLLGGVIVTGYRTVIRLLKRDPEAGRLRLAYFVVALAYSFTEAGFRMMSPVWIAFMLAVTNIPETSAAPTLPAKVSAETSPLKELQHEQEVVV